MSDKLLRSIAFVTTMVGLLDSIYLSYIKLTHTEAFCAGIGECDVVNASPYSEIAGIPLALLGACAYVALVILLIVEGRRGFWKNNSLLIFFGITLIGLLYSAYLTYIEVAVLNAICPFCVISAVAMLVLFVVSILRLRQQLV
jgi:uncharacterized membrane protein